MLRRGGVALAGRLLSHGSTKTSAVRSIRFISSTRVNLSGDTVPSDVADVVTPVIDAVPEIGYYPPDLIARALDGLHTMTGMPYWQAIIVGTVALRVLLLPSSIMGLRASSRIAAVRPEVDQLSKRMEKDPDNKALYEAEIVHIHKKYKVSYISGFGQPLVQLPVFLSTFLALRQMGTYFPEYTSGGTLWFTDLSIADPTFVLPVASAASFLLLTELGSDDVKMQNYPWFKTVMRVMGVGIIPLTYFLPSGVFLYWCTNNTLSLVQTLTLKNPSISNYFGILPPPANAPALKISGNPLRKFFQKLTDNKTSTVEYIDGKSRNSSHEIPVTYNPQKKREKMASSVADFSVTSSEEKKSSVPVSAPSSAQTSASETIVGEPPKTFTAPPKKKEKKRL